MASDALKDADYSRTLFKNQLRQALAVYEGDPHHARVTELIDCLVALNPTSNPAQNLELLEGNWRLISAPIFPDGKWLPDGTYSYTLGRLAFNMFQPSDLTVVIQQVFQPVFPTGKGTQHTHDIVVDFAIAHPNHPPLRGIVRNLGLCEPSSAAVLQVQFTGGILEPAPDTDLQQWKAVFENPTPTSRRSAKEWFQSQVLKFMFGLVPPKGLEAATGKAEFTMRRSPKGSLTILYLDDELRITRGQRETLLICERR